MTIEYVWHAAYKAAILETDWTKMQERLQTAESEIRKRQHVFSMDLHKGSPSRHPRYHDQSVLVFLAGE